MNQEANITSKIAEELSLKSTQINAAIKLLDEGATVPFIARYRKEATGSMDDIQLRALETRLGYLRELEERRSAILKSLVELEKLTPDLEKQIIEADTKIRLEDLYRPFKPKRRTKGQIAKEAGLEPLADSLLTNPMLSPEIEAEKYISAEKGVPDVKSALDGARYILMERFAEHPDLLSRLRERLLKFGILESKVVSGKEEEGAKFSDYFDYHEKFEKIPSHRALALFRGRNEGFLTVTLISDESQLNGVTQHDIYEQMVASVMGIADKGRPADKWLQSVSQWTWKIKIFTHLETELMGILRKEAESEATKVFAKNLADLLMAAPCGPKVVIGLDPGLRTGVKAAIVDQTGKLLHHATIFPHPPRNEWKESINALKEICKKFVVNVFSIGNGTGSRETDRLVSDVMAQMPELVLQKIVVSEAGASVYSASEFASLEFPDLDVSYRGAVSIARRLQDPLAELVKIDPKAIGVGQYQHDVNQILLSQSLDNVVEDCVNAVGVDVNTASVPLLARVSGLNQTTAENIVALRDEAGPFKNRMDFTKVPRLGAKAFEQAAGFLRIRGGENILDSSAVHPEAYPVVERISSHYKKPVKEMIGDKGFLSKIRPSDFADENFGVPTVQDILKELEKPGRDPRPEFKTANFKTGVESIDDVKIDMVLEGVVTNVTNFGAFVDIGVHQDGLVHISALSESYVRDPRDVVKAGDIVSVKVVEVDPKRKRINLTMRLNSGHEPKMIHKKVEVKKGSEKRREIKKTEEPANAFEAAFQAALANRK